MKAAIHRIAPAAAGLAAAISVMGHAEAAPKPGGDLIFAQSAFPPCLDVAQSARQQNATRQILDNLIEQDKTTGAPKPWLATSWAFQDEGRTLILKLRDGVTYSNGEAFDAKAVKANFDSLVALAKQGRAPQAGSYLSGYQGTDVVDPHTVAMHFSAPKAALLQALSEKTLSMLAPATLAETADERCAGKLIATGPFTISQVVTNDKIVLKRRPGYEWASPNAEHQGPAWLNSVTFVTVPEGGVRTGLLVSGQVSATDEIPTDSFPRVKASGGSFTARTAGGMGITLVPNLTHPILDDPAVQQALLHGIDRNTLVKSLYTPYDHAATSILSHTVPGYVDLSAAMAYDPVHARAALDAAGWKPGADGIREKNGKRLQLSLIWSFAGFQPDMELVKAQLADIGVDLQLRLRTDGEIGQAVRAGRWDIRMFDLTRADPDVLLSVFSSKFNALLTRPQPQLDALLDQESVALDPASRAELVRQAQQLILSGGYGYPIKESSSIVATRADVHGVTMSVPRWPVLYDAYIGAGS